MIRKSTVYGSSPWPPALHAPNKCPWLTFLFHKHKRSTVKLASLRHSSFNQYHRLVPMSNIQISPYRGSLLENTEFNFRNLFVHQIFGGPKQNQKTVFAGSAGTPSGGINVNDWAVYEGAGPDAKLVARAQGMHLNARHWYHSFTMVFEVERFKGSTLEIVGAFAGAGELSIVGGSGMFRMARGVVEWKTHRRINDGQTVEISMSGFCHRKPIISKLNPRGVQGNSTHDIAEKPSRLRSVSIFHGSAIDAISFSYIDQRGIARSSGHFGGPGRGKTKIQLGSSEYLKQVSGRMFIEPPYNNNKEFITSIMLVTNEKTYGPFGIPTRGTPFSITAPEDSSIVGFYGSSDEFMCSIGVYTIAQTLS